MTYAHKNIDAVKENTLHQLKFVDVHPLCLTDIHVEVYKHKHMVVIYKTRKPVKHNMALITPTNHDHHNSSQLMQNVLSEVELYQYYSERSD